MPADYHSTRCTIFIKTTDVDSVQEYLITRCTADSIRIVFKVNA